MRRISVAVITLLTLMPALRAQEKPEDKAKEDKPKTPAEQLAALVSELQKGTPEVIEQLKKAKTDEDKDRIRKDFIRREYPHYAAKLLDLAEKNDKDAVGLKAAMALAQLSAAVQKETPEAERFLKQAAKKSSSRKVQAAATFGLGFIPFKRAEAILDENPLETADVEKLNQQAEPFFDQVVARYGDIKPIAGAAEQKLYVLRHLSIGREAQDISGEDADGKKFKLSDYRGKVVVIDFWAKW